VCSWSPAPFVFLPYSPDAPKLRIECWDWQLLNQNDFLGAVDLSNLCLLCYDMIPEPVNVWKPLIGRSQGSAIHVVLKLVKQESQAKVVYEGLPNNILDRALASIAIGMQTREKLLSE
jgi:hypothetical protein